MADNNEGQKGKNATGDNPRCFEDISSGKIRWMCRRGMLELDLLLKNFLDSQYEKLDVSDKKIFIELLAEEDTLLWDWLVVSTQQPPGKYTKLVHVIRQIEK